MKVIFYFCLISIHLASAFADSQIDRDKVIDADLRRIKEKRKREELAINNINNALKAKENFQYRLDAPENVMADMKVLDQSNGGTCAIHTVATFADVLMRNQGAPSDVRALPLNIAYLYEFNESFSNKKLLTKLSINSNGSSPSKILEVIKELGVCTVKNELVERPEAMYAQENIFRLFYPQYADGLWSKYKKKEISGPQFFKEFVYGTSYFFQLISAKAKSIVSFLNDLGAEGMVPGSIWQERDFTEVNPVLSSARYLFALKKIDDVCSKSRVKNLTYFSNVSFKNQYIYQTDIEQVKNKLFQITYEALSPSMSMPVIISYCSEILSEGPNYQSLTNKENRQLNCEQDGAHASLIIGTKLSDTGERFYLIFNSWGEDAKSANISPTWETEKGKVWVDETTLAANIWSLTILNK